MSFDKLQAMRNAERHVVQGKIRAAIAEYKSVVEHDPRDFGTLNMLGDLYVKNSDKKAGIECYTAVAEHYGKQGFSQKAIAIYKKISKLDPNSAEVSAKLAELYQTKGSYSEARSHYTTLAEHYQSQGKTVEALAIWKQVAMLDPNDISVCLKLAESYLAENQSDEAVDAFCEAGSRFAKVCRYEDASANFQRALELRPGFLKALEGLIEVLNKLGKSADAVNTIEAILEAEPYNREALCLLVDCYLGAGNLAEAERSVIRLVEQEPANYPKFLDLARAYLDSADLTSGARSLSLCIENFLVAGQADECRKWIDEILAADPEHLGGLRLQARYNSWQRDDAALRHSLELLAEAALRTESIEDERYALSQLVMIVPQEIQFADRLRAINEKFGFEDNPYDESILRAQFEESTPFEEFEPTDGLAILNNGGGRSKKKAKSTAKKSKKPALDALERNGNDAPAEIEGSEPAEIAAPFMSDTSVELDDPSTEQAIAAEPVNSPADFEVVVENSLEKEIESINFYLQNGYTELATTALAELRAAHGELPEFDDIEKRLGGPKLPESVFTEPEIVIDDVATPESVDAGTKTFDLDEIRSEFGLDGTELVDDSDYDTHYQLAVAYQEMGLMEEAIKEFQDAINLVKPGDAKRRFFQCANLLGHCFLENGMAKLAVKWYQRALETPNLNDDEKKGIWYELALAFEADGDHENSGRYFEQVYSEDVDFRDIGERIKNILVTA